MEKQATEAHQTKSHIELPEYDSNPFTISFRGFGLIANYAKSIIITVAIIAAVQFIANMTLNIVSTIVDSDNNRSTNQRFNNGTIQTNNNRNRFELQNDFGDSQQNISNNSTNTDDDFNITRVAVAIFIVVGIIIILILILIGSIFTTLMSGFIAAGAVAAAQKKNISFTEALSKMLNRFGTLYYAIIISTLKIIGGTFLLIVPGVRATLRYSALPYLIMSDDKISGKEALAKSKMLYKKHLMEVFGIHFVGGLIPIIGSTITAGGMVLSVNQIEAFSKNNAKTPKTHWLNYLGLMIAGLVFLLITLVLIAIFSSTNNY